MIIADFSPETAGSRDPIQKEREPTCPSLRYHLIFPSPTQKNDLLPFGYCLLPCFLLIRIENEMDFKTMILMVTRGHSILDFFSMETHQLISSGVKKCQ